MITKASYSVLNVSFQRLEYHQLVRQKLKMLKSNYFHCKTYREEKRANFHQEIILLIILSCFHIHYLHIEDKYFAVFFFLFICERISESNLNMNLFWWVSVS